MIFLESAYHKLGVLLDVIVINHTLICISSVRIIKFKILIFRKVIFLKIKNSPYFNFLPQAFMNSSHKHLVLGAMPLGVQCAKFLSECNFSLINSFVFVSALYSRPNSYSHAGNFYSIHFRLEILTHLCTETHGCEKSSLGDETTYYTQSFQRRILREDC